MVTSKNLVMEKLKRLKGAQTKEEYKKTVLLLKNKIEEILQKRKLARSKDNPHLVLGCEFASKKLYNKALYHFRMAASQENAFAQSYLGEFYEKGIEVDQSYQKAYYYYKLAADQGNAYGQTRIGWLLQEGLGVDKSYSQSFYYFKLAADQGDRIGQQEVAECYETGLGVPQSFESALQYYRLAANQGLAKSQYNLARVIEQLAGNKGADQIIYYYELAINQKYYYAYIDLGLFLIKNNINKEKGLNYLKILAKGNIEVADASLITYVRYLLGKAYIYGELGVKKSPAEGIQFLKMEADQGNLLCQLTLGIFFQNELLYPAACHYYKLAADQGSALAQFSLGILYFKGNGVDQSYEEAFHYLKLAAQQGHAKAQVYVGNCFEEGNGVQQSKSSALHYYKLSADQNDPEAQCYLAICLEELESNDAAKQIVYYYQQAINQGNDLAQLKLATFLILNRIDIEDGLERLKSLVEGSFECSSTIKKMAYEMLSAWNLN